MNFYSTSLTKSSVFLYLQLWAYKKEDMHDYGFLMQLIRATLQQNVLCENIWKWLELNMSTFSPLFPSLNFFYLSDDSMKNLSIWIYFTYTSELTELHLGLSYFRSKYFRQKRNDCCTYHIYHIYSVAYTQVKYWFMC